MITFVDADLMTALDRAARELVRAECITKVGRYPAGFRHDGAVGFDHTQKKDLPAVTPGGPDMFASDAANVGAGDLSQPDAEVTTRGNLST